MTDETETNTSDFQKMFDKLPTFNPPDARSAGAIALRAWVRGLTARGPPGLAFLRRYEEDNFASNYDSFLPSGTGSQAIERDPAKLPLLRAAHKDAQLHLDYEDASWASFAWSAGALRVVLGGPPCQPVAPTGKRLGISICAFSAVQKSTALSTYEAELYALVLISRTLLAQRRLAEFLLDQTLPTSVVGCDNESTLKSLRRRDLTARNRHIRVYLGFILDAIDSSEIRFEHRVSHLNEANTLTKAEDEVTFLRSLIKLAGLPPNYKLQPASRTG